MPSSMMTHATSKPMFTDTKASKNDSKKSSISLSMSSTVPTTSVRSASSPGLRRNASRELGPIWVKSLIPGFAARISYSTACGPVVTNFGFMKPCVSGIAICKKCPSIVWEDPRLWAASGQQHKCNLWNIPDSQALGGKILDCLFVFGEGSVHRLQGWENQKNSKKTKKTKKNKVWGEMLYPKISSRGLVFLVFLVILVFLEGNGYRAEKNQKNSKKTKKTKKTKKNKVWGEMLYPKISSRGLVFLVILVFFDIFLLLGSWFCEAYVGLKNQSHHFGAGQKPKPPHFNWKDPV